jgi:REP element-mobilizing transposase RayT
MPIAYLITWTTYGSWLPGDARGWVQKGVMGIQDPDPERKRQARAAMVESEVVLTYPQRMLIEDTIRDHCRRRGWVLHAVRARTNHVHVVVMGDRDPEEVRDQLKGWCARKLSDDAGLTKAVAKKAGRRHWFTEGGDSQETESEEHLQNAIIYVLEKQ